MLIERVVRSLPASALVRLVAGSIATGLAISLGMVWIRGALGVTIGPAIPSAVGTVGAAAFAARMRMLEGGKG